MKPIELRPAPGKHVFSGYYDKSPFDAGNARHLALQSGFLDRLPTGDDQAEVGYFDLDSGRFEALDETSCFNWQQGAMLQWLGPDHSGRLLFNRREGNRFTARILDLQAGSVRDLPMPVYAVRPQGDLALTIDFERHFWCRRAYAYGGIEVQAKNQPVVPRDGLFLLDLIGGQVETIVRIEDLLEIKPTPSMTGATHYIEHMMFSPSGERFMFYHRWKGTAGDIFARLYVMELQDRALNLILDSGRLSHSSWCGDTSILAWAAPESVLAGLRKSPLVRGHLGKMLRPVYRTLVSGNPKYGQSKVSQIINGDSYLLIETAGADAGKTRSVCVDSLDRDGHPSALRSRPHLMVTDTYPDRDHRARLLLANAISGKVIEVDTVRSMPELDNTPIRCDLHPKLSFDETLVSIDTVQDGYRAIYVYEIASLLDSID